LEGGRRSVVGEVVSTLEAFRSARRGGETGRLFTTYDRRTGSWLGGGGKKGNEKRRQILQGSGLLITGRVSRKGDHGLLEVIAKLLCPVKKRVQRNFLLKNQASLVVVNEYQNVNRGGRFYAARWIWE